ncbi:MAG: ATP-binding protein [Deltaproteobacteria bacterium]|nr:ATP-binding protein [Deltaproteobacteria bacterium]
MESELVRYSRAGDVFHYRWAARRCLRMIHPKSLVRYIVIEGSKERKRAGEYVIDVAEYSDSVEVNSQEIAYFQLKHTTVRKDQLFNLSDLKDTIEGFAERYSEHFCSDSETHDSPILTFSIVTNRPIAASFKENILTIAKGDTVNTRFQETLEKYTHLKGEHLNTFCALLEFADGEGDYNAQWHELHIEISQLLAGTVANPQIDSIATLVQEKALPNSDGQIIREDILKRFGVTSERDLYPAPPEFENMDNAIPRKQHQTLLDCIHNASTPIIIYAAGGVGKSVFANQITHSLPIGSLGIVYDCFGGGRYRNRSEPRHRHRDALVQIVNELASHGLCDPLISLSTDLEDEILRKFLTRLSMAAKSIRKSNENAILVIVIDAADNAEMAAKEFCQPCFVHELLREPLPDGCRLVALCRTERINLLQPCAIPQFELELFSKEETLIHLRRHFPQASDADGLEFHRLTNNGNPRVQANALSLGFGTIAETLANLGPSGTTVEKQIEAQLDSAISDVKEKIPVDFQSHIDAICLGLATLPPFIPLSVLASAAEVDETTVKSFVADLGRPLWLSDISVQFRDEPTETWFREKFSTTKGQIASYVTRLKPLAHRYSYVAEILPSLLLQAEQYSELINLALSDDLLPKNNPIDERNVRVHRLQFAFKAALKLKRYADATKLALRAGEEVAGDKRQLELLTKNVDLIAPLQNEQRVQELAFRHMLCTGWDGSENVYSAALLSSVEDFKGEAIGYLRAANSWLRLYFEARKKEKDNHYQDRLEDDDIVELAFAYFNLFGIHKSVDFILSWRPPETIYRIAKQFIKRLIDAGNFAAIDEILQLDSRSEYLDNQYMMIAIAHELLEVGRFPSADSMEQCLTFLSTRCTRIPKPGYLYNDTTVSALVSFTEACAGRKLSKAKILRVLRYYVPIRASRSVSSNFQVMERDTFLRAVALKCVLESNLEPNLNELLPKEFVEKEKNHRYEQDVREFKEIVGGLLPWYIVHARILINDVDDIFEAVENASQRSEDARKNRGRDSDSLQYEISWIRIEILTLYRSADATQVEKFIADYLKENRQIRIQDRLKAVRSAFRLNHLSGIRSQLEQSAYDVVAAATSEDPITRAEWYIDLARAVLPVSRDDAAAYFDYAIEVVSKFGDELVQRWEAITALASHSAEGGHASLEMAYRFIRCAELVGDNVAREKHFDRNGAIRICARLSPVSALAALSRWRDRDVGWFEEQLPALAYEIVSSNFVSPSAGWSLAAFFEGYGLDDFASLCMERESSPVRRQYILNSAIRDLRLNEASENSWQKLKQIAQQHSIENSVLDDILTFYAENPEKENEETTQRILHSDYKDESKPVDWDKILDDLELTTSPGISQAIKRFDAASTTFRNHKTFWQEVFRRIDESEASKFLQSLVDAENADSYDIENALSYMPDDWRRKVSVRRNWTKILELIAKRFASEFTNHYRLKFFLERIRVEDDAMPFIREGILKGLSSNSDLDDATTFFGFAEIASTLITPQQATDLLDFALTRFELHIDDEYADGYWANWLNPPEDMSMAFAGFVWSALGSPRAETRWQAAHCVRRLAEIGCEHEIDALIQWMKCDSVDAFGDNEFPFYNLHARQYLLIALARVSIDIPQILKRHHTVFSLHALGNTPHILIQKFSAEIALNIEKKFPNTYGRDVVEQLHRVDVSQLPIKEMDSYRDELESYWHIEGEVDTSLKFYHGYDFDSYWFEPLGEVFGISGKQVEELATEVVINECYVDTDGSFQSDPRAGLWRSSRNERETWHDHGSYPRTDNYSFYLSYHAMFVVAAKLLQKMPVVHRRDWCEDEWAEWLHRHLLTRIDGRWLADRRDPAPLLQRDWIHEKKTENWCLEITTVDFLDGILFERKGETWLNVFGSCEEGDSECEESFYVSTALVSPAASQSLLNALTTCSDPHDFKLPDYQEESMEFESYPFVVKGWVWREYTDNSLDQYDPHASQIAFPPYQVGESIVEKLGLSVDSEQREWFLPNIDKPSILGGLWSTSKSSLDEEPLRRGERLSASLAFLKNLCLILECELIFEVQINRRFKRKSYMRNEDGIGYTPPHNKIYILSADGKLRDAETHYQLR